MHAVVEAMKHSAKKGDATGNILSVVGGTSGIERALFLVVLYGVFVVGLAIFVPRVPF